MKHYVQTVIRQGDDEGCAQIHPSAAELLKTLERQIASNESSNTSLKRTNEGAKSSKGGERTFVRMASWFSS